MIIYWVVWIIFWYNYVTRVKVPVNYIPCKKTTFFIVFEVKIANMNNNPMLQEYADKLQAENNRLHELANHIEWQAKERENDLSFKLEMAKREISRLEEQVTHLLLYSGMGARRI